jgi:acetoin utilization deacetylase AcuC-like enzyme
MAIAIKKLLAEGNIQHAVILDFDLHYGDGTANTFSGLKEVAYFHPEGRSRDACLNDIQRFFGTKRDCDILAISAGFDRHEEDWGGLLKTEDYFSIGQWAKEFSLQHCQGKRFGVLEGGYNHAVLGRNVKRFLQGLSD